MHAVTQSCLTVSDPMDCGLLGSSAHGISQAWMVFPRQGVGCHFLFQGIFLNQGSNLHLFHLLHWQVGSLPLAPCRKPNMVPGAHASLLDNDDHDLRRIGWLDGMSCSARQSWNWHTRPSTACVSLREVNCLNHRYFRFSILHSQTQSYLIQGSINISLLNKLKICTYIPSFAFGKAFSQALFNLAKVLNRVSNLVPSKIYC